MALIFSYRQKSGIIYRFDARMKLFLLIVFSLTVFSFSLRELIIGCGIFTLAMISAGPGLKDGLSLIFSALKFVLFVSFIFLASAYKTEEQRTLFHTIADSAPFLLRLFILILSGFLFTSTTSTGEIRGAVFFYTRFLPRFPAAAFAIMISVTISTIPLFFAVLKRNREALICRGTVPWYRPFKKLKALSFPLLTRLIQRSDILTASLISRGFGPDREFLLPGIKTGQLLSTAVLTAVLLLVSSARFL